MTAKGSPDVSLSWLCDLQLSITKLMGQLLSSALSQPIGKCTKISNYYFLCKGFWECYDIYFLMISSGTKFVIEMVPSILSKNKFYTFQVLVEVPMLHSMLQHANKFQKV